MMINPLENSLISNPKLAESSEIAGHAEQSAMQHCVGVLSEPDNLSFNTNGDGGVRFSQLAVCFWTYFGLAGHESWRGFHGLNLPAKSSCRACRSSRMTRGLLAVSQSSS